MGQARKSSTGWPVRLVALAVVAVLCLGATEVLVRLLPWLEEVAPPAVIARINSGMSLNPYQIPSAEYPRHWRLRPGFVSDVSMLITAKRESGRLEGASILEEAAQAGYTLPITVNAQGFKGPELDPAHAAPRILVIGDSVTFGMGGWDYVRATQGALEARGRAVEMVNGGIEGYALTNALREVPRYLAARPDLCLVVLGWNDVFNQNRLFGTFWGHFRITDLLLRAWKRIADRNRTALDVALERRNKPKRAEVDFPEITRFRHFHAPFVDKVERLGDQLASGGCRVILGTLPALFRPDQMPSAYAMTVGHLPDFTDNPLVLAEITEGLNADYRALAARKGWAVVDMSAFTREPDFKERWFTDSVHFNAHGLTALGAFLADRLLPLL